MNAADRYARCEALVLTYEGGYSNNPRDKGGPTKFGVTLAALSEYRGYPCTAAEVQSLTPEDVLPIYKAKFWDAVSGDQLPAGIDLMVFDAAVNTGPGHAARWLQIVLAVPPDGVIGVQTLRALAGVNDDVALVEKLRLARLAYYRSLDDFQTFGKGWVNRLNACALTAAAWARAA